MAAKKKKSAARKTAPKAPKAQKNTGSAEPRQPNPVERYTR